MKAKMIQRYPLTALIIMTLWLNIGCASNHLKRVDANEFMRRHDFKGMPSDRFIGTTGDQEYDRAYKEITRFRWSFIGLAIATEVLWCPIHELPANYLSSAKVKPFLDQQD